MSLSNIKLIVFDMDGTLINTDELIINSYKAVFKKYRPDYKLTREEELSFLGPPLKVMFEKYFSEDFDTLVSEYRRYANAHTLEEACLYDNVESTLKYLKSKGYILGIISSRFSKSCYKMLDIFNLTSYFDSVIGLDNVSNPKPNPEGINNLICKYNLSKEEVIFIGDALTDYQAGINAGVKVGLVSWSLTDKSRVKLDLLLNNYQDLERIF